MGSCILKFTFSTSFKLLLCFLCINIISTTSDLLPPNPFEGLACAIVNCGEGTCKGSNSKLGFECDCNPGWKQIPLVDFVIPSCVLPNCTVSFQCGNEAPPPIRPPLVNSSSPCNLVFCGQGDCIVNGSSHDCQCDDGYANFLDNPSFACFKQCNFGADCKSLELQPQPPPLPPPPPPPPPPPSPGTSSAPPKTGTTEHQANPKGSSGPCNIVKTIQQLIILVVTLLFLIR